MNGNLAVRNQHHVKSKAVPSSGERQAVESLSELQARWGASTNGLPQAEAQRRLAQYGYNEIPEEKTNPILRFLSYFWGPIPWMIEVAAVLSALVPGREGGSRSYGTENGWKSLSRWACRL